VRERGVQFAGGPSRTRGSRRSTRPSARNSGGRPARAIRPGPRRRLRAQREPSHLERPPATARLAPDLEARVGERHENDCASAVAWRDVSGQARGASVDCHSAVRIAHGELRIELAASPCGLAPGLPAAANTRDTFVACTDPCDRDMRARIPRQRSLSSGRPARSRSRRAGEDCAFLPARASSRSRASCARGGEGGRSNPGASPPARAGARQRRARGGRGPIR